MEVCAKEVAREGCETLPKCLWFGSVCIIDVAVLNGMCFQPAWMTIRRSMDCQNFGTKGKCEILDGCTWEETEQLCLADQAAIDQASQDNEAVGDDFETFVECRNTTSPDPCESPCKVVNGFCDFPEIFDSSRYPLAGKQSPYCKFHSEIVECQKMLPEECQAAELCTPLAGRCVLSTDALVNITYASHPKKMNKIRAAVGQCPGIQEKSACEAFA